MFTIIGIISVLMLLISFINRKYISIILIVISLVFLFVIQYYHGSTFQLFKGNYWIIIIPIIFLLMYFIYLFTFNDFTNFKKVFNTWQKNIVSPIFEELFFSLILIILISNKSTIDSFNAIILASIVFVNVHIILNGKYTSQNLILLFTLSIITKIESIYSNMFFAIITHLLFKSIISIFKAKEKATSIKLLNGETVTNNVHFLNNTNYVIRGENGVGKTTLAKIQSGLIGPQKELQWNNGEFCILMQECDFEFNLAWYNNCYGFGEKYAYWVKQMKFEELTKTNYINLSSGEKQRFKLIITMLINAKKIFFDEIENSLDPKTIKWVFKSLEEYQKNNDVSYIFISHKKNNVIEKFNPIKISFSENEVVYE